MDVEHVPCLRVESDDKADQLEIDVGKPHGPALLFEVVDDVDRSETDLKRGNTEPDFGYIAARDVLHGWVKVLRMSVGDDPRNPDLADS